MAVATVHMWSANPGQGAAFMASVVAAKKIHERLGGQVRVLQSVLGGQPMGVSYVTSFADMAAYAAFTAALEGDKEWQEMWAGAMANPSAVLLSSSLMADVPGI